MSDTKPPAIAPELSGLPHVPVDALEPLQGELKTLSKREYNKLKKSLEEHGLFVPFFVWLETGKLLDGHQRQRVMVSEGWLIDVPVVYISAVDEQDAKRKLLVISSQYGRVSQEGWDAFTFDLDDGWLQETVHFDALPYVFDYTPDFEPVTEDEPGDELDDWPLPDGVPDTVWPSDNEWGIPLLDIERQADAFDLPIEIWGAKARGTAAGTIVFYTEDYRFRALWEKPDKLFEAGCVNAVEPNFSVFKDFPRAVALYHTYQKRWLARFWQSRGIRIFVDLNVNPAYYDVNLLGVPAGWRAYATRGYTDRLDWTLKELEMAEQHAGGSVLFMVYGGGKKVKEWCMDHAGRGVVWVSEDMDRAKGLYEEVVYG